MMMEKKKMDDGDCRGEFPLHQHPPMWLPQRKQRSSEERERRKPQKKGHLEFEKNNGFLPPPPLFFSSLFFFPCFSLLCSMQFNATLWVFPRGCARRTRKNGGFVVE